MSKACKTCTNIKPPEAFYLHGNGLSSSCKECVRAYQKQRRVDGRHQKSERKYRVTNALGVSFRNKRWRTENVTVLKSWGEEYRRTNKEQLRQRRHEWYERNKERLKKKGRDFYEENKQLVCTRVKLWRKRNPGKSNEIRARRRAIERRATPKWADKQAMAQIYTLAKMLTESTGIQHQVDHIIPLNSKTVCGLHWEGNLQILTAKENQRKNNRVDE